MIVVTLTSWLKRINNVKPVVESIMNNTLKPDVVYLNLSKSEFDGIELPKDLVEYFNSDDRLIINWVSGENTKSMKKIFPILEYLKDDDIIIDADDDILFPSDFILSRVIDFYLYGGYFCISSNVRNTKNFGGMMKTVSAMSLFQKKMLNNWELFVDDIILHTYNDDRTYLWIMWLNGYMNKPCRKYNVYYLLENYGIDLSESSMNNNGIHIKGGGYDKIAFDRIYRMFLNIYSINELFGILKSK